MMILYILMELGTVRFNEMQRHIGSTFYKTLSSTLKKLEADQLVHREKYPQIPPRWSTASPNAAAPSFPF